MPKRGIVFAMATVWGFGCVPQPDETHEIIENLAGGHERRAPSPGPRGSVKPRLGAVSGLDLSVRF